SEPFINKVAESGLVTIDLETWYPKEEVAVFDMKDHLFMGMILKEKDFRDALKKSDWSVYENKNVAVTCSADAIIPVWAYMLVAAYLQPVANEVFFGSAEALISGILQKNIDKIDTAPFTDKRIVLKGCGDIKIPDSAYLAMTAKLRPVAKS